MGFIYFTNEKVWLVNDLMKPILGKNEKKNDYIWDSTSLSLQIVFYLSALSDAKPHKGGSKNQSWGLWPDYTNPCLVKLNTPNTHQEWAFISAIKLSRKRGHDWGFHGARAPGHLAVIWTAISSAVCQNNSKSNVKPSVRWLNLCQNWVIWRDNDLKNTSR